MEVFYGRETPLEDKNTFKQVSLLQWVYGFLVTALDLAPVTNMIQERQPFDVRLKASVGELDPGRLTTVSMSLERAICPTG